MSVFLFVSQLLNGLLDGFYYLLIALGLSLIFSLGGIVNLAHGAFFALGAYMAVLVTPYLGFFGALIVAPLMVACIGVAVERLLFTRFYRVDPLYSLLLTFGLAMVIEQALRWSFGSAPLAYDMPGLLRGQVSMGDFIYSRYRIFLIVVAVTAVALLWLLLNRTAFGRIVRAGIQNPDILGAMGISLRPYLSAVAAIAIGLAGLAGVLMAPIVPVHPAMGIEVLTAAFVVVVIGGLGSFWGVVVSALLVGLVKGFVTALGFTSWSLAAIYLLMFIVLLIRPRGLMGERILRFE
ncbi:branched-chain amino acid ABC transporter permease [Paracoccus sediminicola]|uniref:branched-chain amino acid ABC transporter permease n=1 Tax=Paracoccus sediminicola TaxID=3017783 RepID=UPI0022F0936D|nr:branched-chain amino acid ABC transporter permease [Paracoccus sediminicola]WBU56536.1 branched-chain amino acid ABC transporter permease [Paracoccus sediminicola]